MEKFARLHRLPPYVFATVNEIKMEARRAGVDIIDLGMGNPDLATPEHIVDKMVEAARKGQNHRYSASMGIRKLRMAIADWYGRRFDVDIDPEREALVTIGVKEGPIAGRVEHARHPEHPLSREPVITSYSIHYTKLYDGPTGIPRTSPPAIMAE